MRTRGARFAQGLCLILLTAPAITGGVRADDTRANDPRADDLRTAAPCAASAALKFVCGAERPEDLAHIPGTRWLIVSGFQDGAGLKLVDTEANTLERWYQALPTQIGPATARHANCRSPPDPATFNVQGISLRRIGGQQYRLLATNHGGRESIEIFTVNAAPTHPLLTWTGCVRLPAGVAANAVASFSDGTILMTELTRPGTTIADFVAGANTGAVYALAPGAPEFSLLPGTELPANNGLETSRDDREFYVVAFGWHAVVVYSRADTSKPLRVLTAPGFMPDNIHWDGERLIAGGMQYDEPACGGLRKIIDGKADGMLCHRGYSIAQLDASAGRFSLIAYAEPDPIFNGVSGAVLAGNELWLSSYQADRIAHRTLPWLPRTSP
jgi:hypothetical protein